MKEPQTWTHKALVKRISSWLKGTKRFTVVFSELSTQAGETPDVIGWQGRAYSWLIEVKVSRADFLSDKHKRFRRAEESGMGDRRYFCAPRGMLTANEIPDGWGLLEVDEHVHITREATYKEANKGNECVMMMSMLRRLEIATAVYVVQEAPEQEGHNEANRQGDI